MCRKGKNDRIRRRVAGGCPEGCAKEVVQEAEGEVKTRGRWADIMDTEPELISVTEEWR